MDQTENRFYREPHDPTTGEIARPHMPPEIAGAVIKIMKDVKQLGFDEKNDHGKYQYASIDKFMSVFGPACANAGIFIALDEASADVRAGSKEGSAYLFIDYAVSVIHESGAVWGPMHRRCYLPATGPQAFGSAESYVLKRFMRNLFQVPTGEKDADALPDGNIPSGRISTGAIAGMTKRAEAAQRGAGPLPRSGDASTSTEDRSRNSDTRPATGKARVPSPDELPEADLKYARDAWSRLHKAMESAKLPSLIDEIISLNAADLEKIKVASAEAYEGLMTFSVSRKNDLFAAA